MNLALLLEMAASGMPERRLVGPGDASITAAELYDGARAGAAAIIRSGAEHLVYVAAIGPAFPVALFSAALAGVPLVPLNYRLAPAALADLVLQNEPALVIADPPGTGSG